MAERPVFKATRETTQGKESDPRPLVEVVSVSFKWIPGLSAAQKKKNIESLHAAAKEHGIPKVLEVSTKSTDSLGFDLSAFNLQVEFDGLQPMPLECAFQGSKVFQAGGPYTDLYAVTSREAKKDERLRTSGPVVSFRIGRQEFPTEPKTAFYDWLYAMTLARRADLLQRLQEYDAFSDIEFNPKMSFNCQARSCAIAVSLARMELLHEASESATAWRETMKRFAEIEAGPPSPRLSGDEHQTLF